MRAVADTNILISGLLFGGLPRKLLDHATAPGVTLATSEELLEELRDKLANKFHFDGADTAQFLQKIRQIAEKGQEGRKGENSPLKAAIRRLALAQERDASGNHASLLA